MATFKYVGWFVKDNGKVDVNVGSYSFTDKEPDVFSITVPDDSNEEKSLEYAMDPFDNSYLYVKQA